MFFGDFNMDKIKLMFKTIVFLKNNRIWVFVFILYAIFRLVKHQTGSVKLQLMDFIWKLPCVQFLEYYGINIILKSYLICNLKI